MSYGFRVKNPAGDIVVDAASLGLTYIGRPSLVSSAYYDVAGISRNWHPYRYRVSGTNGYLPVVACTLQEGVCVEVEGVQQIDANTWDVLVYSGSYGSYLAFNEPVTPELFAFAPPGPSPAGSFGIALRNGGALRWDLSRRPLWIRQIATLALQNNANSGSSGFTESSFGLIGGLAKPAIFMSPGGFWQATNGVTERNATGSHAWTRNGSTVYRRPIMTLFEPGFGGSLPFPSFSILDTFAVIIDAANLP